MKLLVLAALVAAVATGRLGTPNVDNQWPWQAGKVYRYDVQTNTLARLEEGASTGSAFRARFIVRARAPGRLQAKLENPRYAKIHQDLPNNWAVPADLKYQEVQNLDQPFEINLEGGRVQSLKLPSTVSLPNENLLKGLISALQVDLSAHRNKHSAHDSHDQEMHQGQYRKMETDVTGDCETLYTMLPVASEWHREFPNFASHEQPFEVSKARDYRHCHHRVAYHFGVPNGAHWTGTPRHPQDEQFMKRKTTSRILVGKQGPIYKTETISTVHVSPHLYGKQKAEVRSNVKLILVAYEQDNEAEWQLPEGSRPIKNLLYALNSKQATVQESSSSSSSSSSESHEHHSSEQHSREQQYHQQSQEQQRSEQVEDSNNRVRRSAQITKSISINKRIVKKHSGDSSSSSSSDSSSSSSDSSSAYVNDEVPQMNEPAYASLYMSPLPHVDKKQNPMNAQKLVQEIAQLLQNPNNMPKSDFLSKFNILVRVIATMSTEQLSQTSRSIEVAKSSNNIMKHDMWMIFRDAVAQAGTMPAFQQIKSWLQAKKVQGEEAAQIIASLPANIRYPTKTIMIQFFQLAMSPEVREQKYLNNTALIAATRLINMAQVNNETAHHYYPTHMYGRFANKHDNFVLEQILPQLRQVLQESIQNDDTHKALVYIKAIGNLGHRSILDVFAPYLEGKVQVSNFLRASIVENLQTLAHEKDHYARAVLYSILRNTAEPYEVRVVAIHGLFMSRPTGAMMQAMAQMTQKDPSLHVRAALKGAIKSAAELKNPRYSDLARTAQDAKYSVTKDDFGHLKWGKKFGESFDQDYDLGIFHALSYVASEESLFPKHLKYHWRSKTSGTQRTNTIAASISSLRQFVDQLLQKISSNQRRNEEPQTVAEHKYSAEKISEMLNIKRDPQNPLEASLYIDLMNQQRYFSFTEQDMKQLPAFFGQYMAKLAKGIDAHYTKVFNQAQVSIMFPVASGMPFIYKYKEPTVVHIQSKAKGEIKFPTIHAPEYSSSMQKEFQFTYARNIDGSVGFLDTLANHYVSAGLVNKYQLNIPVKTEMQVKSGEVKIRMEPLHPEQDTTIAYFSVWPYTANQKKDTLTPVSLDPTSKVITRRNKVVSVDSKFGQTTGTQFQLQGYSYSNDYRNFGSMLQGKDLLSNIVFALSQRDVAMTHFNFRFLGKQSPNKAVAFKVVYDTLYNQKQPEAPVTASKMQDATSNSEARRKEIVKRAVSGIVAARARIIDLSATFEGPVKAEYVLTAAVGDSKVDRKIRYAILAARNSAEAGNNQVNAVGFLNLPQVSPLNFLEALKKDMKTEYESDIDLGQSNGNIHIKASAKRTETATEDLKKSPWGQQSIHEIAGNNLYQDASKMMNVMAHAPNYLKASVSYKDLTPAFINMTYQAYKAVTSYGYWYSDINPLKKSQEGKLEVEAEACYLQNHLNVDLLSRYGKLKMDNIPIPKYTSWVLSAYRPINIYERILNRITMQQYLPYCSVDGSKIRTFSNRTYDYSLTSSWHVVMMDDAKFAGQYGHRREQLAVLARRPQEKQQEIYISYKSETGKALEIEIRSAADKPSVKVNAKKVSDGELTMYWDDVKDAPLLQYHAMADGVFMMHIGEDRLRVLYDGQRVVLFANENRNNTRGVCGFMSGEPRDDYKTPYGLVDKPELYAASYALNEENADPNTQKLQSQIKQYAYKPKYQYTLILRSDDQWRNANKAMDSWSSEEEDVPRVYRSRSYLKQHGPCQLQQQVQYYENHAEICISTGQVPACQSHCKGHSYQVLPVQVVCRPKLDRQFQTHRNLIQRGENPQVSGKAKTKQYEVPSTCQA